MTALKKIIIGSIVCTLLSGCFVPARYFMRKNILILPSKKQSSDSNKQIKPHQPPTITVWVHGTRFFYHRFRQHCMLKQNVLIQATHTDLPYKLQRIFSSLNEADPYTYTQEHFYFFSWSGRLCFIERETAAAHLYSALTDLLEKYKEIYGAYPPLKIITHSHGGNVALNLASKEKSPSLTVDELVLLACPVQEKTKHLIKDPMFKKVYALSSALDIVQVLDPQGIYRYRTNSRHKNRNLFSRRKFPDRPNLAQMKIKLDRRAITHFEFTRAPFLRLLPKILKGIDLWHADICYKQHPNKIEKMLSVYTKKTTLRSPPLIIS